MSSWPDASEAPSNPRWRKSRPWGDAALALPTDLCVPQEVQALAAAALAFARPIDILVNNAARTWAAPTLDYPLEAWDRVMDLNLRGLWGLTAALAPAMCEAGREASST